MALAARGKIRHTVKTITFDQINQSIDLLVVAYTGLQGLAG